MCHMIFFNSNASSSINRLEIDFVDGNGYRQVAFSLQVVENYTSAGNIIWKYKLVLISGQVLYAQSKIKIRVTPQRIKFNNN